VTGDVAPPGLDRALRLLRQYDAVVVAAAGNNSCSQPFFPAADERVLAVAAIDADGHRARFSNFGPWVDACAIGVDVKSTFVRGKWDKQHMHNPNNPAPNFTHPYAKWSGTSFAAPRVAGAIAERMATMAQPSARQAAAELLQEAASGPVGFGKRID
jgi:subtilisin family serine protease